VIFAVCTYGKSPSNQHIIKDSIFGTVSNHQTSKSTGFVLFVGHAAVPCASLAPLVQPVFGPANPSSMVIQVCVLFVVGESSLHGEWLDTQNAYPS